MLNAVGYFLGQLIGLALIPAGVIWALRGSRPGRVVWSVVSPARRRAARKAERDRAALDRWHIDIAWWARQRALHPPGTCEYETAAEMVTMLQNTRPGPCPHTGFTCDRPRCPHHPRSPR